jgi:hypothetical protein
MISEGDGKAPQARDRHHRITGQTFGKACWHPREENPARSQSIEAGNPVCRNLAGHKTRGGAAAHILASLFLEITVEGIHPARKTYTIMVGPKRFDDEGTHHHEVAIKRA